MIYDELPCSWRFVDSTDKLNANNPCTDCADEAPIIKTSTLLLPSFVFFTTTIFPITSFILRDLSTGAITNLATEIPSMQIFTIDGLTYVSSNIIEYNPMSTPLNTGTFQAEISDGFVTFYSEPISICNDAKSCIIVRWSHTCDLAGIPYAHLNSIYTGNFENIIMLDQELLFPEYETEKQKAENMLRQTDTFYQSQTRTFSFKHGAVPEWFARTMQVMQLHNIINIFYGISNLYPLGIYNTTSEETTTITTPNAPNEPCTSSLEVKFRQDDAVISTFCCVNKSPDDCIVSCFDVVGFRGIATPAIGEYVIHDADSGIIDIYNGESGYSTASTTCTYVHNTATDQYLYFDGDQWVLAPSITSSSYVGVSGGNVTYTLHGFTLPNSWVYIGTDDGTGCVYGPTPYTAAQFAAGVNIVFPDDPEINVCIKSMNHNCTYDEITTKLFNSH